MRISESWPTSIIASATEISKKKVPSERHVAIIETMEQALLYLRKFLMSEYAHFRNSKNISEKLEQTLKEKNPQTIAFGDDLYFIRAAWKSLGENSHLGKNQLGKKLEGEDFQTVNELCSSWAAIREIWKNHPEPQQQRGINYEFMVPLLQSKFQSKETKLNGLLDVFVECRNAKHHPKDYSIGGFKVNLQLTDSYYEFINPLLEDCAMLFFEKLASEASRIIKSNVEQVEVIGKDEYMAHLNFLDFGRGECIELPVKPGLVFKGEEWYLNEESLLFKAHDLIPEPVPEEASAPLPVTVTQEGNCKGDDGKADEKNEQLTNGKKPPGIDRTPFNVPFQSIKSRFIGRDETLNKIRTELENGQVVHTGPCVLIEGMGGMGKSQLAVEYAHKFRKEYPCGVLWFVANEKAEPQLARFAIDHLGYPEEDKDESLAAMTRLWMNANKDYLLILDNLDDEEESEDFLPKEHKNYHLIGTARERFSADWNPLSLDELSSEDAQLLLVEYMAGYGRDFLGTPEIAELSQALQRHPLALELAGRYMCKVEIAPSKYLDIFKRKGLQTKGLTGDGKTKGTGHLANLAATLAIDFDQLSESPEIFRFLSIFSRWNGQSMSLGLLGKMAGIGDRDDAMLSVKEAATYSLLHLSDDDRVRMHPFMAQALREQVLEQGSAVTLEDMTRAAVSWLSDYRFEEYAQRVALELDSLNKLLEECRKQKLDTLWPQLARELSRQFNFQARYEESNKLAELAFQSVKDQDLVPAERVRYLLILSDSFQQKALYTDQLEASRNAREILELGKNELPELWVETLQTLCQSLTTMALYVERNELAKELTEFSQSKLPRGSRWRGSALAELGNSLESQAKYEEALKVHQDAYQFLKDHLGDLNPWTVTARSNICDTISSLGKYKEALSIREEILNDVKSMYGDKHPITANSLDGLSYAFERNGKYLEALEVSGFGLEIIRKTFGGDHPEYARFLHTKARCLGYLGRYKNALELATECLSINLRHYPERHPKIGNSHGLVGDSLEHLHNFKAAKDHLLHSYEIAKSIYGDEHLTTATVANNLANCLDHLGQEREALKLYEKAVEIDNKTYGNHHPESATALSNLGSTLSSLGKHEQGLVKIQEAVYIKEDILGENHPALASTISTLASCLQSISKFSDALELQHRVLGITKSSLGDKHPRTVESMRRIAVLICLTNGDVEEAHSLASQAYEISCETMGEESVEAAFGLKCIGTCLYHQKKHEDRLKVCRQAYNLARKIFDKRHPSLKGFKTARDKAQKRVNELSDNRPSHGNAMLGRRYRKKK